MYKKSISLFNVRTGVIRPVVVNNTLDVTTPNSDLNIAASQMNKFSEEVNRITPLKKLEGIMALTKNRSGEIKSVYYGSRDHKG